jgi:plastocyanin
MTETKEPGHLARRLLLRHALGGGVLIAISARGAAAADTQVVVDNFTFAPTPVRVKAGALVTWVNHDDIPHSIVCQALRVKSPPMDTNDSFSYTFDRAGRFEYICGLHPHMHGMVVVDP